MRPIAPSSTINRRVLLATLALLPALSLYDEAKSKGWTVISMKNDWKRIFAFE